MSRQKGNIAEDKACEYLIQNGFEVLNRNFYSKSGEIDIIAKSDDVLHFVEVKSGDSFEPIYNITPSKIKKIIKTANFYMKKFNIDMAFCIDAIIISNDDIEFIENITL
jgi:putative endonuclease